MKRSLLLLAVLAGLYGCAGITEYRVQTPDGTGVEVRKTKGHDSYTLKARKGGLRAYIVELKGIGANGSAPVRGVGQSRKRATGEFPGFYQ